MNDDLPPMNRKETVDTADGEITVSRPFGWRTIPMSECSDFRVRIWHAFYDEYPDEPDETVEVEEDVPHLWKEDPWYESGPVAFDIHPEDAPATLYIYTDDSVRPPQISDLGQWGQPIERGLPFDPERYDDYPPYGCELWGRVLFLVEGGLTR